MRLLRLLMSLSVCFRFPWPVTVTAIVLPLSAKHGITATGRFFLLNLPITLRQLTAIQIGFIIVAILIGVTVYFLVSRYRHLDQRSALLKMELKDKDEELCTITDHNKQLLLEKDLLLKKAHHRVKNNLQIMLSLLHTQSAYLTDPAAIAAINDSQNRMQAMVVMQKKLYESEDVAQIEMIAFIKELIAYLQSNVETQLLAADITGTELKLNVTQAGFVGLLINESLISIFKDFDPGSPIGRLLIHLSHTEGGQVDLTINYFNKTPGSLGKIKNSINNTGLMLEVAHQLNGNFRVVERQGLEISLAFAKEAVFYEMN